ncbi:Olfactory Receptor 5I1 [Manis pentadactyla]|nr:Olfactory Receptor 5I1 [Manis pentadactyla]
MAADNCTGVTDFIFRGLPGRQDIQQGLFVLFLLVYGITVVANLGMILLVKVDPRLHSPMYYFLSNLSFCDVCYSSTVSPKMLADFLSEQKRIPHNLCAIQMYFLCAFADVECLLLAVMAYDRYVAIYNPLLYTVAMPRRLSIGPKMLVDIFAKNKSIPIVGCALQFLIFCIFEDAECLLLAAMAFDRYKAISNPLLYTVNMSSTVCSLLTAGIYMVTDFILLGLTDSPEVQLVLFLLFLLMYLITVLGNAGMVLVIRLDVQLHTPITRHQSKYAMLFTQMQDFLKSLLLMSSNQLTTMGRRNTTQVTDFILLGLTDSPEVQLVLFLLFLLMYLITVLGNAGMVLVIRLDVQLHTPMYFFLSHLSFLDLIYSTVTTPKTLEN